MPSISNEIFPDEAAFFAVGGPEFKTNIIMSSEGWEQRNSIGGLHPRRSFIIQTGVMSSFQANGVVNFFNSRKGMWQSFQFLDPFDYTVSAAQGRAILISGNQYQLCKEYTHNTFVYRRPITCPTPGTVAFTGGSGLSLNYNNGILTASSPPSSWSGLFHIQVRTSEDTMSYVNLGGDKRNVSINVTEVFDTVWPPVTAMVIPEYMGDGPVSDDAIEINSESKYGYSTHLISPNGIQEERFQYKNYNSVLQHCDFLYSSYAGLQVLIATFLCARGRRNRWWHNDLGVCRFADDKLTCKRIKFDSYNGSVQVLRYT